MTYLDKETLYYFRDEMEKEAILAPAVKLVGGVAKLVGRAAKGAAKGVGNYTQAMSRASTIGNQGRKKIIDGVEEVVKNKNAKSFRHILGGTFLTGASIHSGKKGYQAFKASRAAQNTLKRPVQSGQLNLQY